MKTTCPAGRGVLPRGKDRIRATTDTGAASYIMRTESQYWQSLRRLIQPRLAYVWKINASYEAGVPDWYASDSQDWWVENKRVATELPPPSLDLTNHKKYLTMHQQLWLERRHSEGRNVGVIVFGGPGHIWLPGLDFKTPITREQYMERAMDMKALADKMVEVISGRS